MKHALGRLSFPVGQAQSIINDAGFLPLSIDVEHAILAGGLPPHHADPFDRILVAQAQREGLTIVSVDTMIRRYAVAVLDGANH